MHVVDYRRGQRALQRTPPSIPELRADSELVRSIVRGALAEKRGVLSEPEAKRVLAAYGIPVSETEIVRPHAVELIMGAAEDPVFGPILMIGHGGAAAQVIDDKALALPPLDPMLAEGALSRTRVDRLLRGYGDRPPAARDKVCEAMVRLSQLIADIDEIAELDINPVLADADGVIALRARIVVRAAAGQERAARLSIKPYPVELVSEIEHHGERLQLRPIKPEDESLILSFARHMSAEDVRLRFFGPMRQMSHEMAARLTQIDYDREMAFLLLPQGGGDLLGVGRLAADPGFEQAEFALTVASDRQGRGYGQLLLRHVLEYAERRGIKRVIGYVLRENTKMLSLAERLGFHRQSGRAGGADLTVVKTLAPV
jgi:acetyltransferase